MDMSTFHPAPGRSGLPDHAVEDLARAVQGLHGQPSVSKMAGSFSPARQYDHDVNFTQAQQQAAARRAQPMQPVQSQSPDRVQRIADAASRYAPQSQPGVHVHVQQAQPQAPLPQPGTRLPQQPQPGPVTGAQIPQTTPQRQLPAGQPRGTRYDFPGRSEGVSSPYGNPADRVARDTASRVLGGYDGSSTVGRSPYQGVYDRIASPYRPGHVSTTPTRGPLGGQFPEASQPDPFREFDEPPTRETPPGVKDLPGWRIGKIPDTAEGAEDAAHGVSRAIRAAGADMPDALL